MFAPLDGEAARFVSIGDRGTTNAGKEPSVGGCPISEILLDDRAGSGDLISFLRHWNISCELTRLEFGDAAVEASGPISPCAVGIEIKKIKDCISSMRSGRFSGHQLPGLVRDYGAVWLVVEGYYGVDFETRVITVSGGKGKRIPLKMGRQSKAYFMYAELDHWLTTLEVKAGIRVRRTGSRVETAAFLADMRTWWEKPWESHKSHLSLHVNTQPADAGVLLIPASTTRKVFAQLPGVGWERSKALEDHFGTVACLVHTTEKELCTVDGIGPKMAKTILESLR